MKNKVYPPTTTVDEIALSLVRLSWSETFRGTASYVRKIIISVALLALVFWLVWWLWFPLPAMAEGRFVLPVETGVWVKILKVVFCGMVSGTCLFPILWSHSTKIDSSMWRDVCKYCTVICISIVGGILLPWKTHAMFNPLVAFCPATVVVVALCFALSGEYWDKLCVQIRENKQTRATALLDDCVAIIEIRDIVNQIICELIYLREEAARKVINTYEAEIGALRKSEEEFLRVSEGEVDLKEIADRKVVGLKERINGLCKNATRCRNEMDAIELLKPLLYSRWEKFLVYVRAHDEDARCGGEEGVAIVSKMRSQLEKLDDIRRYIIEEMPIEKLVAMLAVKKEEVPTAVNTGEIHERSCADESI